MSINRRNQLRAGFTAAATLLLLLILVNLTLYAVTLSHTEKILAEAPGLAALLSAQNRMVMFLVGLISLIYLAGVMLATLLPARRPAEVAPGRERAASNTLDSLAEELDRIREIPDGGQAIREPDPPAPPL